MPVDLVVVNTNGTGPPAILITITMMNQATTGGRSLKLRSMESAILVIRILRWAMQSAMNLVEQLNVVAKSLRVSAPGPDTNQWSRRVDASITDLEDASAFLSTAVPSGSSKTTAVLWLIQRIAD